MRSDISHFRRRRAAMVVEFAMVLPVVLIVVFGMIEISRTLLLQHTADTAAYEGARYAMVPGATAEEATNAAKDLISAAGLKGATIVVDPVVIEETTPLITVQVSIPVTQNSWLRFFALGDYSVSSQVCLMCERPPVVKLSGLPLLKIKKGVLKGAKNAL